MSSFGVINSLEDQQQRQRLVNAEAMALREKLQELQAQEDKMSKFLFEVHGTSILVKEGIPGAQFRGGILELRMLDLRCRLDEMGSRPASVLDAFDAAQALREADKHEASVTSASVLHDARDGINGNNGDEVGAKWEVTVDNVRWLEREVLACEARVEVLDNAVKDALREFRALVAEAGSLDAEAKDLKDKYAQDAPYSPPPADSIDTDVHVKWHQSREYQKFVEKTSRLFGEESDEFFVATQVVSQQHRSQEGNDVSGVWAKPAGKLGSGTFGTVNRLDVLTLDKSFAAKEANVAYGGGGDGEENSRVAKQCRVSLATEMAIHARMEPHPNIAQLVGVDDRDVEKMVVLLDLADGDFHSYAVGLETVSVGVLMRLLADVARGLEYLGDHGFGHNDVKPGNVLVYGESGVLVAKITDLGCALSFGDTKRGEGTIGGRPPEGTLDRRLPCEASQDVFALGHMVLLTLTKSEWKSSNMWISKAVMTAEDTRICTALSEASRQKYLEDVVTPRNQLDPRARASLLKVEHLDDALGHGVKERVVALLVRALSPEPTKRPSMSEMFSELSALDAHLLQIETQAMVPFETAAMSAAASAATSRVAVATSSAAAMDGEGEAILRAAEAASGGISVDVQAFPSPAPAASEVWSPGHSGSMDAVVPDTVDDAAAPMLAVIPSATPVSEDFFGGVDESTGQREGDVRERSGLGLAALVLWPSAVNDRVAAGQAHHEASGGWGNPGSVGGSSTVSDEEELAHVVNTAAGGAEAPLLGYTGMGGGEPVPMAAAEVDHALAPESPPRSLPLPFAGEMHVLRGGTSGLRGSEYIPRAISMNDAACLAEEYAFGGVRDGDGCGDGRYVQRSRQEASYAQGQNTGAMTNTARGPFHSGAAVSVLRGDAGRSSAHAQLRCKPRASDRQEKRKQSKNGTCRGSSSAASWESFSPSHHDGHQPHHHHHYHYHFHYHLPSNIQEHHDTAATVYNGTLLQPGTDSHWSWDVRGGMADPGPPAWPPQHVGYDPNQPPFLAPSPPPLQPAPPLRDPWYVGEESSSGWTVPPAPGVPPPAPWGQFPPFSLPSVAGVNWLPTGQATGLVR